MRAHDIAHSTWYRCLVQTLVQPSVSHRRGSNAS
jgi:hypothetical protein